MDNLLLSAVTKAIDDYRTMNPDVTVMEILATLEEVRFCLTEALLR